MTHRYEVSKLNGAAFHSQRVSAPIRIMISPCEKPRADRQDYELGEHIIRSWSA